LNVAGILPDSEHRKHYCHIIVFIAKALERVGDHAKNLSEYVVYMIMGKDVRHLSADEIEQAVKS